MPLHLNLPDKDALYDAYMPFAEQGGLFVATNGEFEMGDVVDLQLTLPETNEDFMFSGPVIWVTPDNAACNRKPGIGVQLAGEEGQRARDRIETLLAGLLDSDKPTQTI